MLGFCDDDFRDSLLRRCDLILLATFGRFARRTALAGMAAIGLIGAAPAMAQPAFWAVKDAD